MKGGIIRPPFLLVILNLFLSIPSFQIEYIFQIYLTKIV